QPSNDTDTADVAVTRDGIAAGTPAYMAPEQFMGGPIDERTDQFAFCVALWEALHGERPFEGHTRFELADAIVHGRLRAPSSRDIPTWLHAEVERGLAVVPDGRHPSMTALLEALHRDPARRRRRIAGSTAVAGVGLSLVAMARGAPEPRPCTDSDAHLSGVWDDARRSELRAAFAQSEATDALRHADQTIAALDGFARRWVDGHRDACAEIGRAHV